MSEKPPTEADALARAKVIAGEIVNGSANPYEGACRIWKLFNEMNQEGLLELHPFVYWASEWEDRPEDEAFIANAILVSARTLLGLPDVE